MQESLQKRIQPVAIFYSYAPEDEGLCNALEKHLALLRQQNVISELHRRRIEAGKDWSQELDSYIDHASIILLLISADFFNSDYAYRREMQRALELHKAGKARVIPILLRPVDWTRAPFAHLSPLPTNRKSVTLWHNKDAAFQDIAQNIRMSVEKLLQQQADDPEGTLVRDKPRAEPTKTGRYLPAKDRPGGKDKAKHAPLIAILILSLVLVCVGAGTLARFALRPASTQSSSPLTPGSFNDLSEGRFIFDQWQVPVPWKVDAQNELMHNNTSAALADWKMAIDENPSDAESHIYWQDQQALQTGQPYVTVVALVNLVNAPDHAQPGRSRDILQGIALAQNEFNTDHADLKICVLIANVNASPQNLLSFNDAFGEVVQQIIAAARSDSVYRHIVGVVGWPFNKNKDVLQQLTGNHLAVISSIALNDELLTTRGFFSVAPSFQAEAQAAMSYINAHWPGKPVYLLEDASDLYSQQLGDAFYQASGNTAQLIAYTVGKDCHAPGVCNTLNPYLNDNGNAVVYFAGYPDDARFFLDKLRAFSNINVIGGDVLSQMVNTQQQYPGVFDGLYYTAFAFHETVHNQSFGQNFSLDYQQLFNAQRASPLCYYTCTLASNDTILAYDAALVLTQTALSVEQNNVSTKQAIFDALGKRKIQGASGLLSFAADGTLVRENAVLVLKIDPKGFTQLA